MNKNSTLNNIEKSIGCLVVAVLNIGPTAQAEENAGTNVEIEEVVVTAQKRAQSIQEIPASISALNASDLEGLKLRASTEIAAQIPNMQIATPYGDGFPVISLRGVSMNDFSLNQSAPVAIYVDEVYKGNPAFQGVQLFDLERVEVLRGPQGTLYGKNTTGGAVNFIARRAGYETEAYLKTGVGNFNRKEIQGAYQTAIVDDLLAVRIAGTWNQADGWMKNREEGVDDAFAVDEWGGRISVSVTPADDVEVELSISSSRSNPVNYGIIPEEGSGGVGNNLYELFAAVGGAIGGANGGAASSYFRDGISEFEVESNTDAKRKIETDAIASKLNWHFGENLTLTSITSWDKGAFFVPEDSDGSPLKVIESDFGSEAEQFSQDLRITSEFEGDFNFIAGLYYSDETINAGTNSRLYNDLDINQDGRLDDMDCLDPLFYAFGVGGSQFGLTTSNANAINEMFPALGLGISNLGDFSLLGCQVSNSFEQVRKSTALYTDANYYLTDKLNLRFGLRHTEDESMLNDMSARILSNSGNDLSVYIGETIPAMSLSSTDKEWSGKVAIDYLSDESRLLYASYSKGYRSGAYNAQAFLAPAEVNFVDPETLNSFEVGFKSQLLENRMQLNGAIFRYGYRNQQFLNIDTSTLAQTLVNIDSSTIQGFELEAVAWVTESLKVNAGIGSIRTEVDEGYLDGLDLAGNELIAAPDANLNFAADYTLQNIGEGQVAIHFDANYVGEQFFDVFNTESIRSDSYLVSNAQVSYRRNDYSVAFWVKNMSNTSYVNQAFNLQEAFGLNYLSIGAPRMLGIDLSWQL